MRAFRTLLASLAFAPPILGAATARWNKTSDSNPISVQSTQLLGNHTSNVPGVYRDMGYSGTIGNTNFRCFSDTNVGDPTNAAIQNIAQPNTFAVSDLSDPSKLKDFGSDRPSIICDTKVKGMRLHTTSLLNLTNTTGMVFYSNISSNVSDDLNGSPLGSGVATITYNGSSIPECDILPQFWGEKDPIWGDHDAINANPDGNIYLFGSFGVDANPGPDGKVNGSAVYCARVRQSNYTRKDSYEYWDGTKFGPIFTASNAAAVLNIPGQGSIHFNQYYKKYIYLYPVPIAKQVLGTTATQPNGPWSDPVVIYNASEMIYGPVAQPYFDPTGKTLVFDMSIFNPIYTVTAKAMFN